MRLTVLGCSGAEMPGRRPPGYLLDEGILLDGGTITAVLDAGAQEALRHVLVTHAHLDHVRGIPALADNLILGRIPHAVRIHGLPEVLEALAAHLMNDAVWPDFTRLPSAGRPVMAYSPVAPGSAFEINGYRFRAVPVDHSVPAAGYIVEKDGRVLVYTGDTGPTEALWRTAGAADVVIVEVSFPDRMEETARLTGHLTPRLMAAEIAKLDRPPSRVLVTHLKPQYAEELGRELAGLELAGLVIMKEDDVFEL